MGMGPQTISRLAQRPVSLLRLIGVSELTTSSAVLHVPRLRQKVPSQPVLAGPPHVRLRAPPRTLRPYAVHRNVDLLARRVESGMDRHGKRLRQPAAVESQRQHPRRFWDLTVSTWDGAASWVSTDSFVTVSRDQQQTSLTSSVSSQELVNVSDICPPSSLVSY
jgi:hypothetical protein